MPTAQLTMLNSMAAADRRRGPEVFCLSTSIFFADIAKGEQEFRQVHLAKLFPSPAE